MNGESENTNENPVKQHDHDENGRRLGILSNKKSSSIPSRNEHEIEEYKDGWTSFYEK
ncbi:hypothetical protein ACEQPO_08460 [Bacillus sp. SL00103]